MGWIPRITSLSLCCVVGVASLSPSPPYSFSFLVLFFSLSILPRRRFFAATYCFYYSRCSPTTVVNRYASIPFLVHSFPLFLCLYHLFLQVYTLDFIFISSFPIFNFPRACCVHGACRAFGSCIPLGTPFWFLVL